MVQYVLCKSTKTWFFTEISTFLVTIYSYYIEGIGRFTPPHPTPPKVPEGVKTCPTREWSVDEEPSSGLPLLGRDPT